MSEVHAMTTTSHEQESGLEAARNLFTALNNSGVRYCHWKSNCRLVEALCGKTDLDLLVDESDRALFQQILQAHDVRQLIPAPDKQYPGIEHYLGFDRPTGELFHLHVHYQLVLGEQFVKNYRLPLESYFLDEGHLHHGVRVPPPELELIVLAIRALLKYRDRDAVKDTLEIRTPGLPRHILDEFDWLLAQTTSEQIATALQKLRDLVPSTEIAELLHVIQTEPRDGQRLFALRQRLRQQLATYQRRGRLHASLDYFRASTKRALSYAKLKPKRKMTSRRGGLTIAFVGVDGAGKTTVVRAAADWLNWRLNVRTFYMGSSRPLRLTRTLKFMTRVTSLGDAACRRLLGEERIFSRAVGKGHRWLQAVRYLAEGRDRYHRHQLALRERQQGSVVLYDRYPLPGVQVGQRMMDGPRIPTLYTGEEGDQIVRYLAQREQEAYGRIAPPDHLFVLQLSPEVSQQRKPEHRREAIEAKSAALATLPPALAASGGVTYLQADLPLEQVLAQIKSVIWELL